LLHVARYPDVNLQHIARLLEADPMLAGRVMSLVQSPIYAGKSPIRSLDQAVFRIGLNNLRDLVIQAALNMRLFTTDGYTTTMERVRRHSVATAHVSRVVARHTGQDTEIAFLSGLLHDVGIAAALIVIDDLYTDQPRPHLSVIWPAIEAIHETTGLLLARIWDLPCDLSIVIGHHHDFMSGTGPNLRIANLHLAERITTKLGRGIMTTRQAKGSRLLVDRTPIKRISEARDALGLTHDTLTNILTESQETLDTLR